MIELEVIPTKTTKTTRITIREPLARDIAAIEAFVTKDGVTNTDVLLKTIELLSDGEVTKETLDALPVGDYFQLIELFEQQDFYLQLLGKKSPTA